MTPSRSSGHLTLSIDVGTSLIKAVVYDQRGTELVIAHGPTIVVATPNDGSEQDMSSVWDAVGLAAKQAIESVESPVSLICLTAQGDGAWLIDKDGAAVGRAILWNDARSTDEVAAWAKSGVLKQAFAINGSQTNLGLPNSILAHLLSVDAERVRRCAAVLTCGSWIFLKLTGVTGLHPSDASAPWLDIRTRNYSGELLELYGLSTLRRLLPDVLSPGQLIQPLLSNVAHEWGLPSGTPVVLAPYDVVATATGSGATQEGSAFCILGTTLCTGAITSQISTSGTPAGLTLLPSGDGPPVRAFPTLTGTGVIEWIAALLGLRDAAAVSALAESAPPGASGVRIWPYLSPAGEREPFLDPGARGLIGGVRSTTSPADIARATIEALAHVVRECLEATGASPAQLAISGGGSASSLWRQTLADVTGLPVIRSLDAEVGAKGAALYGAVAIGQFESIAEASLSLVRHGPPLDPSSEVRSLYDNRHADFLATRSALSPRWADWAEEDHRGS